jgi:hypothetical protein
MHSGSKFWATLPVAKKKLENEGIISKDKPFILPYKGIKVDEDTIIDIQLNSGPISKEDIYFVLENGIGPSGNSVIIDPLIHINNVVVKLIDKKDQILGFGISVPCTLYIQNSDSSTEIESGMTTHLCVSSNHRHKDLARYVISAFIDHGHDINVYTGYHYIRDPKTAANVLVFNYYRPLNIEKSIHFGYEVPRMNKDKIYNLENLPSEKQLKLLEKEYKIDDSEEYEKYILSNSEFDDLRFFQSQNRKMSIIFSALRFEQLKKQFDFCTIRKGKEIIGVVMFKTLILHIGRLGKGCPTAQICLLEMDPVHKEKTMNKIIEYLKEKGYIVMSGVCFGELVDEKFRKSCGMVTCGIQYLDFYNLNVDLKRDASDVNVLYY